MTAYERICENNVYLFGLLEQLTNEIAFMTVKSQMDEVQHLQQQKDGVRDLIDINLDKMETLWKVKAKRTDGKLVPNLKEQRIILSYQANPNRSQLEIAQKVHTNTFKVSRTIKALLNHQYAI